MVDHIELSVMKTLAKKIKSPIALMAMDPLSFRANVSSIDPAAYNDSQSFAKDYLLVSLLKKWPGMASPTREKASYASWYEAERHCFATNRRLEQITDFHSVMPWISRARQVIIDCIGHAPEKGVWNHCRWSGGATFSTRRGATACKKLYEEKTLTSSAVLIAPYLINRYDAQRNDYQIVPGNRVQLVPKTWKIDRVICIEPSANGFCQQALGICIRSKLLSVGIDLSDQSRNQHAAFCALADDLATLDLEMASDTLSLECVKLLLPPKWFSLLASLRSERTLVEGKWRYLEKFSSMGNAYNFELETLIFYALAKAVCMDDPVLVYGDDIVVHNKHYDDVIALYTFAGFKINQSKSFRSPSRFYESCGKHYFDLEDVTPCYQKEVVEWPMSYVRFHNRLYRWAARTGMFSVVLDSLVMIRKAYQVKFPNYPLSFGPDVGDATFIGDDSLLKRDRNMDYVVEGAWIESAQEIEFDCPEEIAYKFKLADPLFSNVSPRGFCAKSGRPMERYKRRLRIWQTSLV